MFESCFDEEFLRAYLILQLIQQTMQKERLENLMLFLREEVEGQEQISLAMSSFSVKKGVKLPSKKKYFQEIQRGKLPTAFMLLASSKAPERKKSKCIQVFLNCAVEL
ncbi:uncharacterized protein TNCV_4737001 [Trichonephila clavipes]|nr:uncharacterized protein TNCV_4737001 [Trichonephila clavipes]